MRSRKNKSPSRSNWTSLISRSKRNPLSNPWLIRTSNSHQLKRRRGNQHPASIRAQDLGVAIKRKNHPAEIPVKNPKETRRNLTDINAAIGKMTAAKDTKNPAAIAVATLHLMIHQTRVSTNQGKTKTEAGVILAQAALTDTSTTSASGTFFGSAGPNCILPPKLFILCPAKKKLLWSLQMIFLHS